MAGTVEFEVGQVVAKSRNALSSVFFVTAAIASVLMLGAAVAEAASESYWWANSWATLTGSSEELALLIVGFPTGTMVLLGVVMVPIWLLGGAAARGRPDWRWRLWFAYGLSLALCGFWLYVWVEAWRFFETL